MTTIQPFDFSLITKQSLIDSGKIIPANGQKVWKASIFPSSSVVESGSNSVYEKDRIITKIDDNFFSDFYILSKREVLKPVQNGKIWIVAEEFGSYTNSVKRYTQLDRPLDYTANKIDTFINLPKADTIQQNNVILTDQEFVLQPSSIIPKLSRRKIDLFQTEAVFNHPSIIPASSVGTFKVNSLETLAQIFKWAKAAGIVSIYCINEWRPYIISDNWTTNLVYYTIIGSKR